MPHVIKTQGVQQGFSRVWNQRIKMMSSGPGLLISQTGIPQVQADGLSTPRCAPPTWKGAGQKSQTHSGWLGLGHVPLPALVAGVHKVCGLSKKLEDEPGQMVRCPFPSRSS